MHIFSDLKYRLKRLRYGRRRLLTHFSRTVNLACAILEATVAAAAVVVLVSLAVYAGYDLSAESKDTVVNVLRTCQIIFTVSIVANVLADGRKYLRETRIVKWIMDFLLMVSLLGWAMPGIIRHAMWLSDIKFQCSVLGLYAIVELCYFVSRLTGRRTNPSLILAGSFAVFIIIGSLVLMLPRCTYSGIGYVDSLFVASSAVCITGLTSVDIPSTFTPLGLLCISVLVQLGSLGLITFTSFFAIFFTGRTSIYNQLLLKDVVYSKSMNTLVPTLLYVLGFTLTVEAMGAVWVYFTVPDTLALGTEEKLMFACFHSMSSFCNAGFSCLPGGLSHPLLMRSDQMIYVVTSVLVFAGAVGFPILVNFKTILIGHATRAWNRWRGRTTDTVPLHLFDLNTKLVLCTTTMVLASGSLGFFVLEYNNTLAQFDLTDKVIQSVFNSLAPRSAGFSSVNPANFMNVTLLLVMVQMIIGGSSQSMAGGIKVNTLGTVLLNLRSVVRGHSGTSAFGRTIETTSIRRANAVIVLAPIGLLAYIVVLLLLEPAIPVRSIVFEAISALFTVGASLGITAGLGVASKVVLCTAMFIGRVGIISILCGFIGSKPDVSSMLPQDSIIIN